MLDDVKRFFAISLILAFGLFAHAQAYDLSCPKQLKQGQAPKLNLASGSKSILRLCKTGFVLGYDTLNRRPVWSAEFLDADRVDAASKLERKDYFHSEEQLDPSVRRDLRDFMGDGLDRGHLAPSADMPSPESQYESFSLSNIVHQSPEHNRGIWREVEQLARWQAQVLGGSYVVTGAIYGSHLGVDPPPLPKELSAPSFLYKAIYFERLNLAGVYLSPNDDTSRVLVVSLDELEELFGVQPYPSIEASVKSTAYPLLYPEQQEWERYRFEDLDSAEAFRLSFDVLFDWVSALVSWATGWVKLLSVGFIA